MSTATEILPEVEEEVTEADGKAHYVRIKALITGGAVVALCGKKYVPTVIAGAERLAVCAKCNDLYKMLETMYGGA